HARGPHLAPSHVGISAHCHGCDLYWIYFRWRHALCEQELSRQGVHGKRNQCCLPDGWQLAHGLLLDVAGQGFADLLVEKGHRKRSEWQWLVSGHCHFASLAHTQDALESRFGAILGT